MALTTEDSSLPDDQSHRIAEVEKDLKRSSSSTPQLEHISYTQVAEVDIQIGL